MSARSFNDRDHRDGDSGAFASDDLLSRDGSVGETRGRASSHADPVGPEGIPDDDELSNEDEEEISRYMANLLQRSQGSVTQAVNDFSYTPPRKETKKPQAEEEKPEQEELADGRSTAEEPLVEPPRREPVPEPSYNLSAMRELANLSAHSAISRFSHGQLVQMAYRRLALAVMAIIATFALFHFSTPDDVALYALGGIALVVAMVTSVRYIVLARHLSGS